MSKLGAILEAQRSDGLCPERGWCFTRRLRVSKHAWDHHPCGFEQHHVLWQCYQSEISHERVLDRGDVEAQCIGAALCGEASCHHAQAHRWDPLLGCPTINCRKLAAVIERWDEEMRGPPPRPMVACEQV